MQRSIRLALAAVLVGVVVPRAALAVCFSNGSYTKTKQRIVLAHGAALLSGASNPRDAVAAPESLTSAGAAAFDAATPRACPVLGEGASRVGEVRYFSGSGTGVLTNVLDVSDPLMGITSLFYGEANDGLVGRCSSRLGDVVRDDRFQKHLDEVNQLFGLTSFFCNPKSVFRFHANRLKNKVL